MENFPRRPALCAFGDATLAHQAIPLSAQVIDLGQHSAQQLFRRFRGDAGSLRGVNLLPLPPYLAAHVLDFIPDGVKSHSSR
jgi:hypothetical protein